MLASATGDLNCCSLHYILTLLYFCAYIQHHHMKGPQTLSTQSGIFLLPKPPHKF